MQYDGASITPYETMFVPMDAGKVEAKWTYVRTALKYQEWMQLQVPATASWRLQGRLA